MRSAQKIEPCCTPEPMASAIRTPHILKYTQAAFSVDTVSVPGGRALFGTATPGIPLDGEDPLRTVRLNPFRIGRTTVTNREFAKFVEATGYQTEAEKFGWSFVFWTDVSNALPETEGVLGLEWWRNVPGAHWRAPQGPGDEADPDHPAVHISWDDARAFAQWLGGRLPTEMEWEHAARGGLGDVRYTWGDQDPDDTEFLPCNIWQGSFPGNNTAADGYLTTAPAKSFEPNGYGAFNMLGNVWEWTASPYRIASVRREVKQRLAAMKGYKVLKGGSFLCHASYCHRYRIAARSGNSPDSTTTHQGFRVAFAS